MKFRKIEPTPPSDLVRDPDLAFVDDRLRRCAARWLAAAAGGRIPDRTEFGLAVLHGLGLHAGTMLLDVVDGGARFRYRLVGTGMTALANRDATGQYLEDIYAPKVAETLGAAFRWSVVERRPLRALGRFDFHGKDYVPFEGLIAPLSNAGPDVAIVLAIAVFVAPGAIKPLGIG